MEKVTFLTSFKVPKLKSKDPLEQIRLSNSPFKTEIYPRLVDSYIKPKQSEYYFKFNNAWLINNAEAEDTYIKRRQSMRKENPSFTESIGFLYLKSKDVLIDLARSGHLCVGNVLDSCLAKGSMGISVSQHADLYHPGNTYSGVPKTGYILIVKYIKGKINFVPYDPIPMEPQPQYHCHMLKIGQSLDKNCIISKAFHMTQVFIYEYSEDGDILDYPTQILPFAAVEFNWYGSYIYRISPIVSATKPKSLEPINDRITNELEVSNTKPVKRLSRFLVTDESIHKIDSTFSLSCQLVLNDENHKSIPEIKIPSTVYMYMTNPVVFPQLYFSRWKINEVIETLEFEKQLKLFQFYLQDQITKSDTDLLDPLSQDILISKNSSTLLTISEKEVNEPFLLSNDTKIPKFTTYMRIVPDGSKQSRKCSFKLIDHFTNSKTIARISLGTINDQYKTMLFIFPDGNFSRKLGLPSVNTDEYYFHGLLLHFQHPEFTLCHLSEESQEEKAVYFTGLSEYRKQVVISKFKRQKSLIDTRILKQTSIDQSSVQKDLFSNLLKPNVYIQCLRYPTVLFDLIYKQVKFIDTDPPVPLIKEVIESNPNKNLNKIISLYQENFSTIQSTCIADIEKSDELIAIKPSDQNSIIKEPISENIIYHPSEMTLPETLFKKTKKSRKRKKRKRNEDITVNLKAKLYTVLKNGTIGQSILDNKKTSDEDSNLSSKLNITSETFHNSDENDLFTIQRKICITHTDKGCFHEVVNENRKNIDNNNLSSLYNNRNLISQNNCKRMWSFDRSIFRKYEQSAGVSIYLG